MLGTWFIFHHGFLVYLQDFPRSWLQLGWEAGRRGGPREGRVDRAEVCHTQLSTAAEREGRAGNRESENEEIKERGKSETYRERQGDRKGEWDEKDEKSIKIK